MRKKNLSVKVAALAMSGTLAMAPMTVRAEEAAGTTATTSTTAAPVTAPAAGNSATAPVTVAEAPADPATTVPNNVDTVVPDDNKQGTDIKANASAKLGFFTLPLADINASISAEDAKGDKTIAESNPRLENNSITALKNKDVVMQGDLSIAKEDGAETYDSTATAAHDVNKEDSYSLKADLDQWQKTKVKNLVLLLVMIWMEASIHRQI